MFPFLLHNGEKLCIVKIFPNCLATDLIFLSCVSPFLSIKIINISNKVFHFIEWSNQHAAQGSAHDQAYPRLKVWLHSHSTSTYGSLLLRHSSTNLTKSSGIHFSLVFLSVVYFYFSSRILNNNSLHNGFVKEIQLFCKGLISYKGCKYQLI